MEERRAIASGPYDTVQNEKRLPLLVHAGSAAVGVFYNNTVGLIMLAVDGT
jgi:hypothetical protein